MDILRVLEAARAAIGHIEAFERQMAASLARLLSIAFDLPPFAF